MAPSSLVRIVCVALFGLSFGMAHAADTVKLGFFGGLSGAQGHVGEEQLKAFKAAADVVNARGGLWKAARSRSSPSTTRALRRKP